MNRHPKKKNIKRPAIICHHQHMPECYIPPKYHGYTAGDWTDICICNECNLIGSYADFHPADPCARCGAKDKKPEIGRWVPPVYTSKGWKNRTKVKEGYWEICP